MNKACKNLFSRRGFVHIFIIFGNPRRSSVYIDGGTRWTGKHLEVELSMRNLADQKEYTVRNFYENDVYSYVYNLRPIEFMLSAKYKF